MLEHALEDHAGEQGLTALGVATHLLDIVGGPAAARDGVAAVTESMDADGQVVARGRLVDRPVAALAEGLGRPAHEQNLHEVRRAGPVLDFGGGGPAVLVGHHDRGLEARVLLRPFRDLPLIGQHRGRDNPELILALDPAPQVIIKTLSSIGVGHDDLSNQTGLPVVAVDVGDLAGERAAFDSALRIMGEVVGREARAEEVIAFIDGQIAEMGDRAARSSVEAPGVFIGGVAFQGAQGFNSTEPFYPPFDMLGLTNLARDGAPGTGRHSVVAREQIVAWDPQVLFLDLGTVRGQDVGGLHELRTDAAYQGLSAVTQGNLWGVLPNTLYHIEVGSILANAWFIGTITRPDTFRDVDPVARANEIETFLVGAPVFDAFNAAYDGLVFQRVSVE